MNCKTGGKYDTWKCARCGGTFGIYEPMHGCYGGKTVPPEDPNNIDHWLDTLTRMAWFVGRMSDPDDDTYIPSAGMMEVQAKLSAMLTRLDRKEPA